MKTPLNSLGSTVQLGLLLLTIPVVLLAQSTWNGLRFGMTQGDVNKALEGKAERVPNPNSNDDLDVLLTLPDFKVANLSMRVNFWFGKTSGNLERISLVTVDPFKATPKNDQFLRSRTAIRDVEEMVAGKYGPPATIDGECNVDRALTTNALVHSCNKVYSSGGQRITLTWSGGLGRITLLAVRYEPQPNVL